MSIYDQNDRQPKVDRKAQPIPDEAKAYVTYQEAAWPALGVDLNHIIREGKLMIPLRLTYKQILLLDQEVVTPRGNFPSPTSERLSYPTEWNNFILAFYKMPQWAYRKHSMSTIIDLIRSYHFINGWLTFRPEGLKTPTQKASEPQKLDTWLK